MERAEPTNSEVEITSKGSSSSMESTDAQPGTDTCAKSLAGKPKKVLSRSGATELEE